RSRRPGFPQHRPGHRRDHRRQRQLTPAKETPMLDTLQSHWGFTVMPFTASIPVSGLFGCAAHKEAVARLRWLISAPGLDASRHTLIYRVGLDYSIWPGQTSGLGSSLSDLVSRLPRRALSARLPDGAGPACGVQGRR